MLYPYYVWQSQLQRRGNRASPTARATSARVCRRSTMSTIRRLALATSLTLATGAAFAGTACADEFWDRYHNQQDRIEQGVENGSLTRGEANRLENQEQQLRRERERLAHNGLSQHDRQVLNRDLNRESRAIPSQRMDDQRAGRGWGDDRDPHHPPRDKHWDHPPRGH